MGEKIDITGRRYGRLVAIEPAYKSKRGIVVWKCRCDCGEYKNVLGTSLRSGQTMSCGCYMRERNKAYHTKHGEYGTRLYRIWRNMKQRCTNPKANYYDCYGGRSISVCAEWEDSFESFYEWSINNGYCDSLTLDRINNDCGYEPNNCRWVTMTAQNNNKRNTRKLTYKGKTLSLAEWSRETGIRMLTIRQRIDKYNWPIGEALGYETHQRRVKNRNPVA